MPSMPRSSYPSLSRRRLLGLAVAAVGPLALLAACGGPSATTSASVSSSTGAASTSAAASAAPTSTSVATTAAATSAASSVAAAASTSSAVSSASAAPAGAKTFKIAVAEGGQSQAVQWDPIWKAWNALHPEFKTDANVFPGLSVDQYREKVITQLAGGSTYDALYFHHVISGEFMGHGLLTPIDSYVAKDASVVNTSDYSPYLLNVFGWKGKQYGLPQEANPWIIWYNADLFDSYGLQTPLAVQKANQWKWADGFMSLAKSATRKDSAGNQTWGYGGYGNGRGYWGWTYWLPIIWSNGGDIWNSDFTQLALDQPAAMEGLQFFADLSTKDDVAPPQTDSKAWDQTAGTIAMGSFAPFTVPNFDKFHWKAGMLLNPSGSTAGAFHASGSSAFGIFSKAANPDLAWEWCKWDVTEALKIWLDNGFFTAPPRKSLTDYAGWVKSLKPWENQDTWAQAVATIRLPQAVPGWTDAINLLSPELDSAFQGKQSVANAIAKVKAPITTVLQQSVSQ